MSLLLQATNAFTESRDIWSFVNAGDPAEQ